MMCHINMRNRRRSKPLIRYIHPPFRRRNGLRPLAYGLRPALLHRGRQLPRQSIKKVIFIFCVLLYFLPWQLVALICERMVLHTAIAHNGVSFISIFFVAHNISEQISNNCRILRAVAIGDKCCFKYFDSIHKIGIILFTQSSLDCIFIFSN